MEAAFFTVGVAILCSIAGIVYPSQKQLAAARVRSMAAHQMNARLLRFNL